jgi:tetratricopeptide (TPR) repeat protein
MSGSPSDAQLALEDANFALRMLPENPLVLWQHLRAELVAATLFQETGQKALEDEAWAAAEQDELALEKYPGNVEAHRQRAFLHRLRGQRDAELDELRQVGELTGQYYGYARALYERGEFARASQALDDTPSGARDVYYHIHRAFIVAELPDGCSRAMRSYEDALATQPNEVGALDPAYVLYFLGRRSEGDALARRICAQGDQTAPWVVVWYRHITQYACEAITAEQLLALANKNRMRQCEAHFTIGLRMLADGERTAAAEHFRAAVDTRVFVYYEHVWSSCFLARLEQDPTWPPWIPVREATERRSHEG